MNNKKYWNWGNAVLVIMMSLLFIDVENGKFDIIGFLVVFIMIALLSLASTAFIIMLDKRKQKKLHSDLPSESLEYCAFRYSSLNLLEEQIILDGFYKTPIAESNYIINWFCKRTNRKSKLKYHWIESENIIFADFTENMNVKSLLKEIDKANKFEKNCVEYAVICIIGKDISRNFILQMLKNAYYTLSPIFMTIVIDDKNNKVYKVNIPNGGNTKTLYNLANRYF